MTRGTLKAEIAHRFNLFNEYAFDFTCPHKILHKSNEMKISRYLSVKGTVIQIEKALINNCKRVSYVSRKFHIPTIYNFAVIYP